MLNFFHKSDHTHFFISLTIQTLVMLFRVRRFPSFSTISSIVSFVEQMDEKSFCITFITEINGKICSLISLSKRKVLIISLLLCIQSRRRLMICDGTKSIVSNQMHVRIPNGQIRRDCWTNLCLDVNSFIRECFATGTSRVNAAPYGTPVTQAS